VAAVVSDVPQALGKVTSHEIQRAVAQVAAPDPAPRRGSARYEGLENVAMKSSLEVIWIQGQAAEMGIRVSAGEISREVAKLKRQNFHSNAEYRRFLRRSHYSPHDVYERVKVQIIATRIQERVLSKVEYPGQQEHVLDEWVTTFHKRWRARTVCAAGHVVASHCSNGKPA
jgi:hypothetical protein